MQTYISIFIKSLTTAYSTHSTSILHCRHALKNPQVSHYSRLLKLCWLVIAQRPQPDYSSSQSPSGWLGSEYELSHCNKPHLVTGSIVGSLSIGPLCKQATLKHHYREIAQALVSNSELVWVRKDERIYGRKEGCKMDKGATKGEVYWGRYL